MQKRPRGRALRDVAFDGNATDYPCGIKGYILDLYSV